MAVVRLEALRGLAAALATVLPGIPIEVGQIAPAKRLSYPSVAIVPTKWRYWPEQEDTQRDDLPSSIVVNVGRHETTVQLMVAAATPQKRAELEQTIFDLFLGTELHPGVLLTQVTSITALGSFTAAWELEADEWRDEMAFSDQWWTMVEVTGIIPALVTRGSVYTIDHLRLGIAYDLAATIDADPFETTSDVEVVEINEDGTLTAV